MRSTAELIAVLREHGWKVTAQRIAMYQTLHELVEVGEVGAVHIVPGPTRFDPTPTHHDHLVCDVCEAITDVVLDLPAIRFDEVGDFRVDSTDVVLRGVCGQCRRTHVSA
jgi:Fur family transcriptional regulator, peroxide stress response regulator